MNSNQDDIAFEINKSKKSFLFDKQLKGLIAKDLSRDDCKRIIHETKDSLNERIKGQEEMIHTILLALIINEHVLLEGLPGVGKTIMIEATSEAMGLPFQRVQFIPDMLPSDLIGRDYLDPILLQQGKQDAIQWINGPLFASMVLADEINRAPSKVQAALLEAMGEQQITPFGKNKKMVRSPIHEAAIQVWYEKKEEGLFKLKKIYPSEINCTQFNVFATMNPIEQEGTYPLSEAQLDRFCFKVNVDYPNINVYSDIIDSVFRHEEKPIKPNVIYGQGNLEQYYEYFQNNEDDMEPVLAPLYFFMKCRDHIFGHYKDKNTSTTLWNELKGHHNQYLEKIFDLIYFSSYKEHPNSNRETYYGMKNHFIQVDYKKRKEDRKYSNFTEYLNYVKTGASPRGVIKLTKAVLGDMLINDDSDISENIKKNAYNILKHRIRLDVKARLKGITTLDIIDRLCETILNIK